MNSVRPLVTLEDPLRDGEILIIVRNMAGEDVHRLAVATTAYFWYIRAYVAMKWSIPQVWIIHLMLDYNKIEDHVLIRTLVPTLESTGNVIQLLVEEWKPRPTEFVCANCGVERHFWECMEFSEDPSQRCCSCDEDNPHVCCYIHDDAEEADDAE